MKELVSVIIPILNPNLSPTEERLLHRSIDALDRYPIIFITYPNADLSIIKEHREDIDVNYFPKEYFESRQSLSRLLLMEDFYDHFSWASYLLIHELNSWVVKDELHYWCKQGYDYLKAAPLTDHKKSDFAKSISQISGLNTLEKQELGNNFQDNGLYLCLIERMISTLKSKQKIAYQYRHQDEFTHGDSVFWEIEANRFWPSLRKPSAIVQNYFAQHVENKHPANKLKPGELPFAYTGVNNSNIEALPFFDEATK